MCGIAGYFRLEDKQAPRQDARSAIDAMNIAQKTRGPDHADIWESQKDPSSGNSRCVLGHTRLSILDLNERSNQPMVRKRWALAFNGEIYNFRAVKIELESEGISFETTGDTEVLLQALETWGVDKTVEKIAGMFAFAAYDQETHTLHLVRDRMGIKPLYYCVRDGAVYFASSPAAIVKGIGTDADWKLNWDALYSYFLLGATSGSDSLFEGVKKVDAAEAISFRNDACLERKRYWTPQPRQGDLAQILKTVVDEHREADVPTALFLSGGVDSSVLAALMGNVDCFHLRSEETDMARYVAEKMGSELTVCDPLKDVDYEEILEDYARTSGAPSASSPIPYLVSKSIRAAGYPVAFSANGGDELFHGYSRTPSPELNQSFMPSNGYETPSVDCLVKQIRSIFRSPENFSLPGSPQSSQSFIDLFESMENRYHLPDFPKSASHRWLELQTYVLQDLNPTLDYASMAHSVEVRVPFLDHRIVEAALTADANQHITVDYGRKSPLKELLDQHGFHPIIWARQKMGFSLAPDAIAKLQERRLQSLGELKRDGFLAVDARTGETWRDLTYLGSAAQAFLAWKRVWIDTGIVAP
ncbi:MAG: asparagine synthase (glutamine-hydrolyzing) [Verrucomicrobiota bacterium]